MRSYKNNLIGDTADGVREHDGVVVGVFRVTSFATRDGDRTRPDVFVRVGVVVIVVDDRLRDLRNKKTTLIPTTTLEAVGSVTRKKCLAKIQIMNDVSFRVHFLLV